MLVSYRIRNNSSFERHWTYAVSIHARSHEIHWECLTCGRRTTYPSGAFDITIEAGTAYPDLLQCGAWPLLIVSERVVAAWERHGIGPIIKFPVGVAAANDTNLAPKDAPPYFRINVYGGINIDVAASGGQITDICSHCGEVRIEPANLKRFAFVEGSWDGNDLFRDCRLYPSVTFCTQKVKQLIESDGFTNFRFEAMV